MFTSAKTLLLTGTLAATALLSGCVTPARTVVVEPAPRAVVVRPRPVMVVPARPYYHTRPRYYRPPHRHYRPAPPPRRVIVVR